MRYLSYLVVMCSLVCLGGCGPLAAVGALGSTITNASYNSAERELNNPGPNREEQAYKVAQANLNLGIEYMRQGELEKALSKLERATLAKPDFAPAYNMLGLLYQRLGKPDIAEENFRRAIKLEPSDSSALNNYGLFLCSEDRKQEARETFQQAVDNPLYDSPEIAYTNAGMCTLEEDKQLAEDYFTLAISKNRAFAPALMELAELAYQNQDYQLAHDFYSRYRLNAPQNPRSLWLGIRISHELGHEDDLASYSLLLKNKYPDANEAALLKQFPL